MADADCIFCRIVAGEAPASVVYEDEGVLAFLDIRPVNAGHALVIPRRHVAGLDGLDVATGGRMFAVGQSLAAALRRSGLRCDGVNLHLADGAAAGQEVFHLHLHVVPRFAGDGAGLRRRPGSGVDQPREELDVIARRLREAIGGDNAAQEATRINSG